MAAVDKTYGDALFSLITEEDEKALPDILGQLKGVSEFCRRARFYKAASYSYYPYRGKDRAYKRSL